MKFHGQSKIGGTKRVASEEIIEIEDLAKRTRNGNEDGEGTTYVSGSNEVSSRTQSTEEIIRKPTETVTKFAKPMNISVGAMSTGRNALKNLVKRKTVETVTSASANNSTSTVLSPPSTNTNIPGATETVKSPEKPTPNSNPVPNGLSLLAGYDDDSSGSDNSDWFLFPFKLKTMKPCSIYNKFCFKYYTLESQFAICSQPVQLRF